MLRRVFLAVGLAVLALSLTACGGDPLQRQPVRGTIQFQGKPIKYGSVRFEPAGGQPTGTSADIRDGNFNIPRSAGLSAGKYAVWVQAFDRIPEAGAMPGAEGPPPKDILPPKYASAPAGELEVKPVPDDQPNELTLDLK